MNRRTFITTAAATLALPGLARATSGKSVAPAEVLQALAQGKTVFVDFYTDWCTTCRAQGRAIEALRAENPAYDAAMEFYGIDWDVHAKSELAQVLKIPRRSTLVVLKADREYGRIVAGTSKSEIKALMDKGLEAAS